ncbi:MAG: gamma carbonic anhydrase family protein [Gemmatimonadota bacterium]
MPFGRKSPRLPASVYVAAGAFVIGDVEIGEDSSVWFNTVVRGDIREIRIGRATNIQDNSTVHVTSRDPVVVGDEVTVGHGVTVHGCTIEDLCLIGIGSIVLDGAVIGRGSVIGAGAVVAPGTIVPPGSLVLGVPGKVVRALGPGAAEQNRTVARHYVEYARSYREKPA